MRKQLGMIVLIVVFLAVFVPFASSNPDGLEKVASTFGAKEQPSIWNGLMADYSVGVVGNSYVSTVLAGVVGVFMVLLVALLLGKAIAPKSHG